MLRGDGRGELIGSALDMISWSLLRWVMAFESLSIIRCRSSIMSKGKSNVRWYVFLDLRRGLSLPLLLMIDYEWEGGKGICVIEAPMPSIIFDVIRGHRSVEGVVFLQVGGVTARCSKRNRSGLNRPPRTPPSHFPQLLEMNTQLLKLL